MLGAVRCTEAYTGICPAESGLVKVCCFIPVAAQAPLAEAGYSAAQAMRLYVLPLTGQHTTACNVCREAMKKGAAKLLEPIMKVEVTTPEEHMGDVIGDLNSRRGMVCPSLPAVSSVLG